MPALLLIENMRATDKIPESSHSYTNMGQDLPCLYTR
jgi:hypothetical protein